MNPISQKQDFNANHIAAATYTNNGYLQWRNQTGKLD